MNSFDPKQKETPHISVVIPVYKTGCFIKELYERLNRTIEAITPNYEIIMVEDCGGDNSWQLITELSKMDRRVKGIQFSRNFGQHHGITAGLDYASGDWVIVMDGDLQDRPEEISKLYNKALEGFDVVMACRAKRRDPLLQRVGSALFYKVFNYFTGMNYNPQVANYRIISKKVVVHLRKMREQLRFFGGFIDWLGFPSAYVEVEHAARGQGKSTYNFRKKWRFAYEAIISYSDKPLMLAIQFGFIMALGAFAYGIYIIIKALFYGFAVQGWSSLITSVFFVGGIIISILGILGIYLGKTFDEVKRRPLYVIKERVNV